MFYAPLKTTLVPTSGSGSVTYSRASLGYLRDFERLWKRVPSGCARFAGARIVRTRLSVSTSEDFSSAGWPVLGFGVASVAVKTPNYGQAPDGSMTACRLQMSLNGGVSTTDRSGMTAAISNEGSDILAGSVFLKLTSGSAAVVVQLRTALAFANVVVNDSWQRFSSPGSITSTESLYIWLRGALGTSDAADILVWHPGCESVAGQLNSAPGEYTSIGVESAPYYHGAGADGCKFFDYENGNTVASNVVTEAQGAAISAALLKGVLIEEARTNSFLNSTVPASHTSPSLATGTYTLWVEGSGSMAVAAGTATGSGFGTAAAGNPVTFTITGAGTVTFTETGTVDRAQCENGAYATSFILTAASAATRQKDLLSYPVSGNIETQDAIIEVDWTPQAAAMGTVYLWGSYVDASNYTQILHDGTNLIFRKRIAGVDYDATKALAYVAGTTYSIKARTSRIYGMQVWIDGAAGTSHANTSAMQLGSSFQIGADGNGTVAGTSAFKNVWLWPDVLDGEHRFSVPSREQTFTAPARTQRFTAPARTIRFRSGGA